MYKYVPDGMGEEEGGEALRRVNSHNMQLIKYLTKSCEKKST